MSAPADNARLGIVLMVGFCVLAPLSEVFVKLIGATLPLLQVVLARFAAQLLLVRRETWNGRRSWMTLRILPLI
ncbi:MAG: EamA/RhaT family transporter, partial [Pseudomonadota bacterium]